MEVHEVANLFPMMSDEEFDELVEDIKKNGQIEPIWTHEGKIIDGRNRYKACERLGIDPNIKEWDGDGSLVSFVISMNLKRRHLTASQKAAIATDVLPLLEKEARERQIELAGSRPNSSPYLTQKIAEGAKGESRDQAAKIVGTNRQYVSDAKRIKNEAPEVFNMMKTGEVNINRARQMSEMPKDIRNKYIDNLRKEERGKTKTCTNCGELLPVEKMNGSMCYPCKHIRYGKSKQIERGDQDAKKKPKQFNQQPPNLPPEEIERQMFNANVQTFFRHLEELTGFIERTKRFEEVVEEAIKRDNSAMINHAKSLEKTLNLLKTEVV